MINTIKIFTIVALVILTGVGCKNNTNRSYQPSPDKPNLKIPWPPGPSVSYGIPAPNNSTTAPSENMPAANTTTTQPVVFLPTTIDFGVIKNFSKWPLFHFKELDISMRLPFTTSSISSSYLVCKNGKPSIPHSACDEQEHESKRYSASIKNSQGEFSFLGSQTFYYQRDGEWSPLMMFDFKKDRTNYKYLPINAYGGELVVHPIKTYTTQGHTVVVFDLYKDLYEKTFKDYGEIENKNIYGVLIKLSADSEFKAAAMEFWQSSTGLTLDQVDMIARSIRFTTK